MEVVSLTFCLAWLTEVTFSVTLEEADEKVSKSHGPFVTLCKYPQAFFSGKSGPSPYGLNGHNLLGNNYLK